MTDCWLDPQGNVYYVEPFQHDEWATEYLQNEFPRDNVRSWVDSPDFHVSYNETLQRRGWLRYTTTIDRWSCEHCSDFLDYYPEPTTAQVIRMYELTGFNYDDPESYSRF